VTGSIQVVEYEVMMYKSKPPAWCTGSSGHHNTFLAFTHRACDGWLQNLLKFQARRVECRKV